MGVLSGMCMGFKRFCEKGLSLGAARDYAREATCLCDETKTKGKRDGIIGMRLRLRDFRRTSLPQVRTR